MSYKEKSIPLIEKLNSYENNLLLTDGHKTKVTLAFKLSSKIEEDYFYAEIESVEEYILITNHIKNQVNTKQFSFVLNTFNGKNKYLTIGI